MNTDERIISLLEDILAWQRLAAREDLLPFLERVLADPKHLKAYDLTDGTRTQQQVATGAGLSQAAISGLWAKWRRLGIVQDKAGKTVHIVKPSDYGLEVPDVPTAAMGRGAPKKRNAKAATPAATTAQPTAAPATNGVQAQ